MPIRLVLFQPDIAQNAGTMLRLAACLGVPVDVVEPCGFVWEDRRLRRAGMDYLAGVDLVRPGSWTAYQEARRRRGGRLLLLTTEGERAYTEMRFRADDELLVGREAGGAPAEVHGAADARLVIPMQPGMRALNVALAAAMVVGEALRQTHSFRALAR